jgi:hypothetical protein
MAQVACLSELETLSSNPSTANKKTPGVVCVSGELGVWRCPNCLGDSPLLSSPVLSSPLLFSLFFLTRASYCGHGMPPDHTIPHCSACPGLSPATLWGDGLSCPSHIPMVEEGHLGCTAGMSHIWIKDPATASHLYALRSLSD